MEDRIQRAGLPKANGNAWFWLAIAGLLLLTGGVQVMSLLRPQPSDVLAEVRKMMEDTRPSDVLAEVVIIRRELDGLKD